MPPSQRPPPPLNPKDEDEICFKELAIAYEREDWGIGLA